MPSINILGLLHHADESEFRRADRPFDVQFLREHAQIYEQYGYDRVLIGQHARSPDSLAIAAHVAATTKTLKFMIAHRPGFVVPTMAARMFATIDRVSGGRAAAHIITGASDAETQCDGDFLTKADRYERSFEYVGVLRTIWQSAGPVDHDGAFYAFKQGYCDAKPVHRSLPIFWGGASELGVEYGARCADVYAMGGGSLQRTQALVDSVRAIAAPLGRHPEFCMSMRIILGDTPENAWSNAAHVLQSIVEFQNAGGTIGRDKGDADRRAMEDAETASRGPDPHLWTGLTTATQGRTHITCLVGTPAQLTEALLQYHAIGIQHFILTGFDPIPDTIRIGRELIPALQAAAN